MKRNVQTEAEVAGLILPVVLKHQLDFAVAHRAELRGGKEANSATK